MEEFKDLAIWAIKNDYDIEIFQGDEGPTIQWTFDSQTPNFTGGADFSFKPRYKGRIRTHMYVDLHDGDDLTEYEYTHWAEDVDSAVAIVLEKQKEVLNVEKGRFIKSDRGPQYQELIDFFLEHNFSWFDAVVFRDNECLEADVVMRGEWGKKQNESMFVSAADEEISVKGYPEAEGIKYFSTAQEFIDFITDYYHRLGGSA